MSDLLVIDEEPVRPPLGIRRFEVGWIATHSIRLPGLTKHSRRWERRMTRK